MTVCTGHTLCLSSQAHTDTLIARWLTWFVYIYLCWNRTPQIVISFTIGATIRSIRAPQLASAARGVLQHTLPASCWPASILFRFRPYLWSLFLLEYARLRHVPGIILHRYKNLAEESDFLNDLHTVLHLTVLQKPNTPHLDTRSARIQFVKSVQRQ